MQDRYLNASEQPQNGVGSSRRPSVVGIGLMFASVAVTFLAVWKLHASGVALWRWQSLVVGIPIVCLAIGFTIMAAVFTGGPISGGAFNPAVGFGATLGSVLYGSGGWSDLWIYVVGPFIGAAIGAGIHRLLVRGEESRLS